MEEKTKEKKVVTLNELENKEKQELKKIFLHFTRKNNQESIEKIGLDVKFGHEEVESDILKEVYEKMYEDLKDRIYYSVDLEEGIDYEKDGIDDKKVDLKTRLENNDIPEHIVEDVKWQYGDGDYGNFDDIKQEKWNRNTIRGKVIEPEKLMQIASENGSLSALDIMLEKYEHYDKTKLENLKELEELVEYCKERKKEERELEVDEQIFEKNEKREITTESLLNQVYDKYTDIEQINLVEKTLENDEKEIINREDKIQEKENEIEI